MTQKSQTWVTFEQLSWPNMVADQSKIPEDGPPGESSLPDGPSSGFSVWSIPTVNCSVTRGANFGLHRC